MLIWMVECDTPSASLPYTFAEYRFLIKSKPSCRILQHDLTERKRVFPNADSTLSNAPALATCAGAWKRRFAGTVFPYSATTNLRTPQLLQVDLPCSILERFDAPLVSSLIKFLNL